MLLPASVRGKPEHLRRNTPPVAAEALRSRPWLSTDPLAELAAEVGTNAAPEQANDRNIDRRPPRKREVKGAHSAGGSSMENSFEPGGIFYRFLRADAARWVPKRAGFLDSFGSERAPHGDLADEVEELRHRVAESQRSTEERKAMFVRELNKLRIERESLLARIEELEQELSRAERETTGLATTRAQKVRRGLVATSGLAAAAGVVKLALSLRQAFEGRGRRPRVFRPRHA